MCGWHAELADLARPLVAAKRADAFEQPYLCVDATGVLVQTKHQCSNAHFWVVVAPERHVLFEYTRQHDGDAVDDVLAELILGPTPRLTLVKATLNMDRRARPC
jgi:transposase